MLSVEETAARLGVTPARVRVFIRDGRLRAEWVGRNWVLRERTVERFAEVPRPAGRPKG